MSGEKLTDKDFDVSSKARTNLLYWSGKRGMRKYAPTLFVKSVDKETAGDNKPAVGEEKENG